MKNAQHRRNTAKQYKPGNTGVGTGGLAVSTFMVSLRIHWMYLQTQAVICVGALQGINLWQRIADKNDSWWKLFIFALLMLIQCHRNEMCLRLRE